ncbi:hypothetical protein LSTR_LSTR010608 [Laodelphax striatellus]|uniref:MADF domain-containing protein n=1 Tax=Laodelphax striatellus TaxID=195883 RepID=A0A482XJ15_LAOST|nr:hypothetical protein LSTR_LSTR010608 [Laodelphax striatellus]
MTSGKDTMGASETLALVSTMEEFPELYNFNLKEYKDRQAQDSAWRTVAKKVNSTEAECKTKWRHIRMSFSRYIRGLETGNRSKKQYYLWDELQFLRPFAKSKHQSAMLNCGKHEQPLDIVDVDTQYIPAENLLISTDTDPLDQHDSSDSTRFATQTASSSTFHPHGINPDLEFFKSILPDIANFTPAKKRTFKRKILDLIDELSEDCTLPSTIPAQSNEK